MARSYSCIDPQCKVVIERASEEWSSSVRLMINEHLTRASQQLDPTMMLNIMSTLCYAYQAQTGDWPQLVKDGKMLILDATNEDKLYLERCKKELDKSHGLVAAEPKEPIVTRVRVRPVQPSPPPPVPASPPVFRQRVRSPQ